MPDSRQVFRLLRYITGIAILVALVVYVVTQEDLVKALREVSLGHLIALILASLLADLMNGARFNTIGRMFGLNMDRVEWLGLAAGNNIANQILPIRGGLVLRAGYLAHVHSMPATSYAAMTILAVLLQVALAAGLGLVASIAAAATADSWPTVIGTVLAVCTVASIALLWALPKGVSWAARWPRLRRHSTNLRRGMLAQRQRKGPTVRFLLETGGWFSALALRLWLAFAAIGVTLSVTDAVMIEALVAVVFLTSLTPGDLGVKEGAIAFGAHALGIDLEAAVLASLIDRGIGTIATLAVTAATGRSLLNRIGSRKQLVELAPEAPKEPSSID
jgi:uncharacterized protein (TIRG00374 family)